MGESGANLFMRAASASFVVLFWAKLCRSRTCSSRKSSSLCCDPSAASSSSSHCPCCSTNTDINFRTRRRSSASAISPSITSACATPFACSCPSPESCSSLPPDEKDFPPNIAVPPPLIAQISHLSTAGQKRKCNCRLPNTEWNRKCVVVLVGLPARGKSYIAKKLINFLRWQGIDAKMFNVGAHRREVTDTERQDASFFDPKNKSAAEQREQLALDVLTSLLKYLAEGGTVGIFDATNTTAARRRQVMLMCEQASPLLNVVFVECICDDPAVIRANLLAKIHNSPDFKDMTEEEALADITARVANYQKVYETLSEKEELAYIKIINLRSQIICNGIYGKIPQLIALVLMSAHIHPRPIYLTRAGFSSKIGDTTLFLELHETLGTGQRKTKKFVPPTEPSGRMSQTASGSSGNMLLAPPPEECQETAPQLKASMQASLSPEGQLYAARLAKFITAKSTEFMKSMQQETASPNLIGFRAVLQKQSILFSGHRSPLHDPGCEAASSEQSSSSEEPSLPLAIYTSTHLRALQTAKKLMPRALQINRLATLNILNTGIFYNKSAEYLARTQIAELQKWKENPFRYRFPEGESQLDQTEKLVPLIIDLERQLMPVLVVSHSSTLQVLYGYFAGLEPKEFSLVDIPMHTVVEFVPSQYGWKETWYELNSDEIPQGTVIPRRTQFYDADKNK